MNYFEPSREMGASLRRAMEASLWTSVAEMLDAAPLSGSKCATPLDYGAYSDLALDVPEWQNFPAQARAEAEFHLRGRLTDRNGGDGGDVSSLPAIRNFSHDAFSSIQLQRVDRWFGTEKENVLALAPVDQDELCRVRQGIIRAFSLMELADPELFGEIISVVDDVIVVRQDQSRLFEFTAAASFAVWGAIVANAEMLLSWTECYNMLAHEGGHILLFAIARDKPLVLNGNEKAFSSPVRDDPRPMDGIYHTAFVTSREARAKDRLLAWNDPTGKLSPHDRDVLVDSLETSVITFWQSVEALDRDASLTGLGESILDECKDYMTRNFELIFD